MGPLHPLPGASLATLRGAQSCLPRPGGVRTVSHAGLGPLGGLGRGGFRPREAASLSSSVQPLPRLSGGGEGNTAGPQCSFSCQKKQNAFQGKLLPGTNGFIRIQKQCQENTTLCRWKPTWPVFPAPYSVGWDSEPQTQVPGDRKGAALRARGHASCAHFKAATLCLGTVGIAGGCARPGGQDPF